MPSWIFYVVLGGAILGGLYYYNTTINVSNVSVTVPAPSKTGQTEFGTPETIRHMAFPGQGTNPSSSTANRSATGK